MTSLDDRERARGPYKKLQLDRIIQKAIELQLEQGSSFSLNKLAREMKMAPSNIYNYFKDIRELHFAISGNEYFNDFVDGMSSILDQDVSIDKLLEQIFEFFFNYAQRDYAKYNLLFNTRPPPSKDGMKGPYEENFQPTALNGFIAKIQESIGKGELYVDQPFYFGMYVFNIINGAIMLNNLTQDISMQLGDEFYPFVKSFFLKQLTVSLNLNK
ncbi:MAG: TetR/AcrR family transcriptional regulator [Candidatus Kariarchaeaceae archaeon]|jgi:AcrR family transcriptional regulator